MYSCRQAIRQTDFPSDCYRKSASSHQFQAGTTYISDMLETTIYIFHIINLQSFKLEALCSGRDNNWKGDIWVEGS